MNKKAIKIYDLYEGSRVGVGYADTWQEVKDFCRLYDMDTDGENWLWIAPFNEESGLYRFKRCGVPVDFNNRLEWCLK